MLSTHIAMLSLFNWVLCFHVRVNFLLSEFIKWSWSICDAHVWKSNKGTPIPGSEKVSYSSGQLTRTLIFWLSTCSMWHRKTPIRYKLSCFFLVISAVTVKAVKVDAIVVPIVVAVVLFAIIFTVIIAVNKRLQLLPSYCPLLSFLRSPSAPRSEGPAGSSGTNEVPLQPLP